MNKTRIKGGIKHYYCSQCNKNEVSFWTYKDTLFQCNECKELYVVIQQDLLYGDFEKQLKKTCVTCEMGLKEHLEKYTFNSKCDCCQGKLDLVSEDKDIYLKFYDIFS